MGKSNSYYMQLHVEALFTMNEKNELMTIREPWDSTSQPAPRFYLTRPLYEKPHTYFRADVPKELCLKSATKLFSVLLASKRPLITELADKLRLKYPLLPTISPCPTMRLEAIRSIIPISCRRYPKSV